MTITLIIEDGSGVLNANCYNTLEEVRAYAENRGVVLPVDDDELAVMVIKSTDYLEMQACRYQGLPTSTDQSLQFPRTGVYINGDELPYNVIPKTLKNAQSQLVIELNSGFDLQPTITPQDYIIKEKTGPLETQYADPLQVGFLSVFTAVNALLSPLFGECAVSRFTLRTIRV